LVQDVLIERLATFLAEFSGSYPCHPLPFYAPAFSPLKAARSPYAYSTSLGDA